MRRIRIWHLVGLALSVPLLAAAAPPGCYGGLNPQFVESLNQDPATRLTPPAGYEVIAIFDETGWSGWLDVTITQSSATTGWRLGFNALDMSNIVFACDLLQITIDGGTLLVPDDTGQIQQESIQYSGPTLDMGQEIECGTLVKMRVVPIVIQGNLFWQVAPGATPQNTPGLEYHVFVDIIK